MSDRNPNKIGALWFSQSSNPNAPFAKGTVEINGEKISLVVWRNKWKKDGEKTPDLYIEIAQPYDGQRNSPPAQTQPQSTGDLGYGRTPTAAAGGHWKNNEPDNPTVDPEMFVDDIPF